MKPIFLYNPEVIAFDYGTDHPFRLERVWLTEYICRQMGWLDPRFGTIQSFEPAEPQQLRQAHSATYLDILKGGSEGLPVPGLSRHGLGSGDNPVFPGLWEYVLCIAGGSREAASLLMSGESRRVFHPGGGLHHAMPNYASGFCYVNDVVLAIWRLLDKHEKVMYIDLDAHHGDGVQEAFYENGRVLTLSIHQSGLTLFPGTGFPEEIGHGEGEGSCINIDLLPHMSDDEYLQVFSELVTPIVTAFDPPVIVTELGADALLGDPLTNMELSLRGWWSMLRQIAAWDIPWLAVGGGGYDLGNAMRAWAMVWAAMIEQDVPDRLPAAPVDATGTAASMTWPEDFWTAPGKGAQLRPGHEAITQIIQTVKQKVFQYHGLNVLRR